MPIEIQCQQCNAKFRVGDQYVGKRVKCAKCRATIVVEGVEPVTAEVVSMLPEGPKPVGKQPAAKGVVGAKKPAAAAGVEGDWFMQSEEGEQYGPVSRTELEAWVAEGRLDAGCQLLREGWEQWKWAEEVFPQLSATPAAPPAAEQVVEVAPIPVVEEPAVVAIAPVAVNDVVPYTSPVAAVRPRERETARGRRQYPALKTAAGMYTIFAWIVLGLGALVGIAMAGAFFLAGSGSQNVAGFLGLLLGEIVVGIYTFIGFISLKAAAEFIGLAIYMEQNTHESAEACAKMAESLAERK